MIKHRKINNKGFTLVELIVVLVILAILAAILVPALLGYIDRSKNSQLLINGKNALNAAQAEFTELYAKSNVKTNEAIREVKPGDPYGHWLNDKIVKVADLPDEAMFAFKTDGSALPSRENHSAWTVTYFLYAESTENAIFFNGTSWEEDLTLSEAKSKMYNAGKDGKNSNGEPYGKECLTYEHHIP